MPLSIDCDTENIRNLCQQIQHLKYTFPLTLLTIIHMNLVHISYPLQAKLLKKHQNTASELFLVLSV